MSRPSHPFDVRSADVWRIALPATLAFDYPTGATLLDFLEQAVGPMPAAVEEIQPSDATELQNLSEEQLADLLARKLATMD